MSVHTYPHPILAREGWLHIALCTGLAALITWYGGLTYGWPLWVIAAFVVQFFRDPPRAVPLQENAILSPADGRIVRVERIFDPYARRDALLISVFMNVFNVHSNRCSVNGTVREVQYFPGKFLNADLDKASSENERNAVVIDAQLGSLAASVTLVQVAGLIARRIACYTRAGASLRKGERYGFIRFGSRVDVYLPPQALPVVVAGQKVRATTSILATLE